MVRLGKPSKNKARHWTDPLQVNKFLQFLQFFGFIRGKKNKKNKNNKKMPICDGRGKKAICWPRPTFQVVAVGKRPSVDHGKFENFAVGKIARLDDGVMTKKL